MVHFKKLDHSALIARDLERSRWFYGHVLELEEIPRPSTFTFGGCWFRGPGFELHLILAGDTPARAGFDAPHDAARLGLAHQLGFEVANLDEAVERLCAHGIQPVAGPLSRGDGGVQVYVNDPDGNFRELFAWDPHSTLEVVERPALAGKEAER
jgi:catechol 2,3-dioxygenase-like lactoylglutathione lyase family enzyme